MEKFGLKKVVGLITQALSACVRRPLPYSRLSLPSSRLSLGAVEPSLPYFSYYPNSAFQRSIATVDPLDSPPLSIVLFPPSTRPALPLNAYFIFLFNFLFPPSTRPALPLNALFFYYYILIFQPLNAPSQPLNTLFRIFLLSTLYA